MGLSVTVQEGQSLYDVPPGSYRARLAAIKELEPMTLPDGTTGDPLFAWEFEVLDGAHRGKSPSALTPRKATLMNGLGKLLRSILGRQLRPTESIQLETFVGKEFTIHVDFNKSGSKTRVQSAHPAGDSGTGGHGARGTGGRTPVPLSPGPTVPPPRRAAPAAEPVFFLDAGEASGIDHTVPRKVSEIRAVVEARTELDWDNARVCRPGAPDWEPLASAVPAAKDWLPVPF